MANLFDKAKKEAPAKESKSKDKKVRVALNDSDFFLKIKKLQDLTERMKTDKAEADIISDELKGGVS